jgi:site-specific DNA recombinase
MAALASFNRDQHALIADAIAAAQADHAAGRDRRGAELATAEREIARTGAAIDRYLAAFENGTLDPEDLAGRLAQLKARSRQLRARREELASELTSVPAPPPPATLRQVADHIDEIIDSGSHNQRKALIEALVAQVKITGPARIVPVFRIPQPQAGPPSEHRVRALINLVELRGLEPLTPCLQSRCSSS